MGSIIGALIGRHLRHTEEAREVDRKMTLEPLAAYLRDPSQSQWSPDQVKEAIKHGIKAGTISKHLQPSLEAHVDQTAPQWEAAQSRRAYDDSMGALNSANGRGPSGGGGGAGMGMPVMPGQQNPTGQPSAFNPAPPEAQQQQQLFTPANKAQIIQMAMAAQQQQGGGQQGPPDPTKGLGPAQPPGLPAPPPFANGAGPSAAPAPANIPAPVRQASVGGGVGFGGPVAAPAPAPPPVQVAQAAPAPKQPLPFWQADRSAADIATTQAEAKATGEIAYSRAMAKYGAEAVRNSLDRFRAAGGDPTKLTYTQLDSLISGKGIPEMKGIDVGKDSIHLVESPGGGMFGVAGPVSAVSTPAGGTSTITRGPAPPGQPFDMRNPSGAMQNPPAGTPTADGAPSDTYTVKGGPRLSTAQQAANAAWSKLHGGQETPADKYAEALSTYTEGSMSKSAKELRDSQIRSAADLHRVRQLDEQKFQQQIREFNMTKGPEAIDALADQVKQNPDLYQKLTGDTAVLVARRFGEKYNLPAPRQLPTTAKNKEDATLVTLNHIAAIREMLDKYPVIQKRLGAFKGREGEIEQALGSTAGLTKDESTVVQDFRTRIAYLFAQEQKAVFGGRTAVQMVNDLKKGSPSMEKGMPMFMGALNAMEAMGNLNRKSADDYRYNRQPGMAAMPPGGMPQQPAANPNPSGYVVGHKYGGLTYQGGDPNSQQSWK